MSFFVPSDEGTAGQVDPLAEAVRGAGAGAGEQLSRRERAGLVILFAAAVVLLFGALGSRELWKSEARWGEVAREMMLTGDYFRPTINWVEYFDKPLVGYWLVVLAAKACGGVTEWAVRLPSVLAGLVALAATVSIGRRLWSGRVAITAGWLLLTSYGFLFYARIGMADMENVAAIMLALAWYWRVAGKDSRGEGCENGFLHQPDFRAPTSEEVGHPANPNEKTDVLAYAGPPAKMVLAYIGERPGILSYAVFYLICAVGAQTKGLTAILVPMAAILPDLIRGWRWRRHINVAHVVGVAIGAAVYLAPFLGSHGGLGKVWEENFQRAVDPFDHEEPVYAYLYHLPILFMPWSPVLILAIGWAVCRWKQATENTRWLALAMLMIFAFFTASGSRRSYYILPILPLAALLCAVSLWAPGTARKRAIINGAWWVAVGAGVAELLGPVCARVITWKYGLGLPAGLVWGTPVIGLMVMVVMLGKQAITRVSKAGETPAPRRNDGLGPSRPPPGPPLLRRGEAGGGRLGRASGKRWSRWLAVYPGLGPVVAAAAVILGGFFLVQYPAMSFVGGYRSFAGELRARLGQLPGTVRVGVYKEAPEGFVYYMNEPRQMRPIQTSEGLEAFLGAGPGPCVMVVRKRFLGRLRDLGVPPERIKSPDVKEEAMPWEAGDRDEYLRAFFIDTPVGARKDSRTSIGSDSRTSESTPRFALGAS